MTHGTVTLAVTVAILAGAIFQVASLDLLMMGGLTLLLLFGVLTPAEAFVGFANEAVLSVAALFVIAQGIRDTGALDFLVRSVLGRPKGTARAQLRLMLPVGALSAFLNNTPVVAMLVPVVLDWSRRIQVPASKLMMPLSFAAMMGGACTIIGTSTNLVVYGLALEQDPEFRMGIFDLGALGLPALLGGTLFLVATNRWLLPDRQTEAGGALDPRRYTVAMRVEPDSPIVDRTIEDAGLRHLPGLFLVGIERQGESLVAVNPQRQIRAQDILVFAGLVESVVDLRRIRGLVPATDQVNKAVQSAYQRRLVEAVVAPQSALVGKSIRQSAFRTHFHAAIIAVHRGGEQIRARLGDIVLEAGDTLLLETRPNFTRLHRNSTVFALVGEVAGSAPPRHDRAWIGLAILASVIALHVFGFLPLLVACLAGAGTMLLTRCLTTQAARHALDIPVLITIAASFGISGALEKTGIAQSLGDLIGTLGMPYGAPGLFAAVYVATSILTSALSNNAAAAIMYPIVASVASVVGVDLHLTLMVLMVAASAAFATPIGYQTNLMVLGPGGYRFSDFVRVGVPLQIVTGIITVATATFLANG